MFIELGLHMVGKTQQQVASTRSEGIAIDILFNIIMIFGSLLRTAKTIGVEGLRTKHFKNYNELYFQAGTIEYGINPAIMQHNAPIIQHKTLHTHLINKINFSIN